jgi:hypothetical protein
MLPLLRRAGLSGRDFDGRQRRIPAASQAKFLEFAAEAMDNSAFGLHLAEEANPREAGVAVLCRVGCEQHRRGDGALCRYSRIANARFRAVLWLPGRVWRITRSSRISRMRGWPSRLSPKIDGQVTEERIGQALPSYSGNPSKRPPSASLSATACATPTSKSKRSRKCGSSSSNRCTIG